MKRFLLLAFFLVLAALPSSAQLPPGGALSVGNTPIQNGTNGLCLYQTGGKLGEQACGTGTAQNIQVGTTTIGGGTTGRVLYDNAGVLGELTVTGTAGSVVLSESPQLVTPSITSTAWASFPAAGTAGRMIMCSNCGTKGSMWLDDGTRWKPMNGTATLASLDTQSSDVNAVETIVFQYQLPAAFWQVNDRLRLFLGFTKSGTTNTTALKVKIGTAGTTGDTNVINRTVLGSTQQSGSFIFDIRLNSSTSAFQFGNPASGYGAASTSPQQAAVTISNVSNSLYITVTIQGGASDSTALADAQLVYVSTAN